MTEAAHLAAPVTRAIIRLTRRRAARESVERVVLNSCLFRPLASATEAPPQCDPPTVFLCVAGIGARSLMLAVVVSDFQSSLISPASDHPLMPG
jgi:hypothetical protein